MRWSLSVILVAAFLATPAQAQFFGPAGGGGFFASPEAAGALGAGAASRLNQQPSCMTTATGRDGPRGLCLQSQPEPTPPAPKR